MNSKSSKIITDDVVRHVARLSRLHLDDEQTGKFREQLSAILDYVDQLSEVDVEGVHPTTHVLTSMKNVFREDEARACLSPDEALANAPARSDNFFKVPKVIKDA